jgi:hypothetical protein
MKRIRIVQAALLVAIVAVATGCSSGREYNNRSYPPRSQSGFSLIINASPGLVIMRNPYGMYYYRDTRGFIYWRGYGNRYYLDRKYVNRSYNRHQQYNDWRRYHYNGRRRR